MKVFKYINKKDKSLIGYHLSTFCQVGSLKEAKRYRCTDETVNRQLEIIQNNFKSVINATEENQKDKFISVLPIKNQYFNGLKEEDVEIQHEDVPSVDIVYKIQVL